MALQDTIKGWPWHYQAALFLVMGAALFWIGKWQMLDPMDKQMADLKREKESLIEEINKGETLKARSIEFEAELKRLQTQLDSLKKILPETEEIAELYSRIQQEGMELGLNITQFKPGNHVPKEYYEEWPISMNMTGSYHILAKFFERIGKLYRIINVNDFSVKAVTAGSTASVNTLTATCVATTFIYKESTGASERTTKKKEARS